MQDRRSWRTLGLLSTLGCAVSTAFGGQSLVLTPGRTGAFTLPNVPAFTSMGSYRIEMRVHNYTAVPNGSIFAVNWWGNLASVYFKGDKICASNWQDSMPDNGNERCLSTGGLSNDILIRVQRNTSGMFHSLEVWDVANSVRHPVLCGVTPECSIAKLNTVSWAVASQIGGSATSASVAWIKLFSTNVELDAQAPRRDDPADLLDWQFEGSLIDSGPYRVTLTLGGAAYAATPAYPPVCHAGAPQSFRAGVPASLDGSGSYDLDDGPGLNYRWHQISGPSEVVWNNSSTVVSPSISGLVFGSYVFQLTVQDQAGRERSCSVKHGAVASDDSGIVSFPNDQVAALLHPMIRWGASPWPWYDERHKALADLFGSLQASDYLDVWNVALAGTIDVTRNSTAVTGTNTSFQSTFCGGGTVGNSNIIIWYPIAGSPGRYGRRAYGVASCQSDTQLTLRDPYSTTASASGLSYSRMTEADSFTWINQSTNANYYDNVMAFYALYYRSGIDVYRDYARTLADRWWTMPFIDEGRTCNPAWPPEGRDCLAPRLRGITGLVLRALDGRPEMWSGFHGWWDADRSVLLTRTGYIGDLREESLVLYGVALCALLDPDTSYRAGCAEAVTAAIANRWVPQQSSDLGTWLSPVSYLTYAPWNGASGTVNVTNGSRTVIGVGTDWKPSWFTPTDSFWVTNSPTDSRNGDPTTYSATYVSPTEIRLDRPYEGTTSTGRGWQAGGLLGWGTQPFMAGIAGTAFHFAYQATGDERAKRLVVDVGNWIWNYGYRPSTKGLYYGRHFANCEPISDNRPWCSGEDVVASRAYSGEVQRALAYAYLYSGSSTLLAAGDTLHGATYGKLGGPNSDGLYDSELDSWTVQSKKAKDYGFHFGFGGGWAWPAARLGGAPPAGLRTGRISTRLANVPAAARLRLQLTAPNGQTTQTDCSASPCAVLVDQRQGDQLLRLEYVSADGRGLAVPSSPTVLKAR
jgi:hypothetical protein